MLITGFFALAGAAVGALLSGAMSARAARQSARLQRLETALRSVAVAIAAQNFTWSASGAGAPSDLDPNQLSASEHAAYLRGLDHYFEALQAARRDVALLVADGIDLGDHWQHSARFAAALPDIYRILRHKSERR